MGFEIATIAIRGADRVAENMTPQERQEQANTFDILPIGWHIPAAHFATILRRPGSYLAGLMLALRLGGANPLAAVFHLIYFIEAVAAGHHAVSRGFRHLHTHFSSTVALIAAKVFGLGLSITIHGPDEFRDRGFQMPQKVAASRFVSAISFYGRSQIMQASDPVDWPKIKVCPLGVDPAVFSPAPRVDRTGSEPFRIICVGRLAAVKAQRVLISACALLIATGAKLRLHLVGSGPDREALEAYSKAAGIAEHVIFEGPRHQGEVVALYQQSDIFALASFAEGLPVVLFEAMAMELPCVSTWVNGIPELISNGENGLLVAASDVEGLAAAIERLMQDQDLRERLGKAGRRKVLMQYDLHSNTALLAAAFREFLQQ